MVPLEFGVSDYNQFNLAQSGLYQKNYHHRDKCQVDGDDKGPERKPTSDSDLRQEM